MGLLELVRDMPHFPFGCNATLGSVNRNAFEAVGQNFSPVLMLGLFYEITMHFPCSTVRLAIA